MQSTRPLDFAKRARLSERDRSSKRRRRRLAIAIPRTAAPYLKRSTGEREGSDSWPAAPAWQNKAGASDTSLSLSFCRSSPLTPPRHSRFAGLRSISSVQCSSALSGAMSSSSSSAPHVRGVVVRGPMRPGYDSILTTEAVQFLADLHRKFEATSVRTTHARVRG